MSAVRPDLRDLRSTARAAVEAAAPGLVELSRFLHANPELAYEERLACEAVARLAEVHGFTVERGVGGIETALAGTVGHGGLELACLAEYDALPGMGHACGHNLIAASSVGAAIGLAAVADQADLTVRLFGTPAEEGGGGKVAMLEAGCFDGIHAALMMHPAAGNVLRPPLLGHAATRFTVTGREAHAASYPEEGRNAADAMTLAQVAIGLLRQHTKDGERIHGVTHTGWQAGNVIPAHASATISVRAPSARRLAVLRSRVVDCFRAAALATGTTLEVGEAGPTYAPMVHDDDLLGLYADNWQALGHRVDPPGDSPVYSSSDLGNLSQLVAAITPTVAFGPPSGSGVGTHEPEFAGYCVGEMAEASLVDAAVALAWTGLAAALSDAHRARLLGRPLVSTRSTDGLAAEPEPRS